MLLRVAPISLEVIGGVALATSTPMPTPCTVKVGAEGGGEDGDGPRGEEYGVGLIIRVLFPRRTARSLPQVRTTRHLSLIKRVERWPATLLPWPTTLLPPPVHRRVTGKFDFVMLACDLGDVVNRQTAVF
jgi:hypothetical protein